MYQPVNKLPFNGNEQKKRREKYTARNQIRTWTASKSRKSTMLLSVEFDAARCLLVCVHVSNNRENEKKKNNFFDFSLPFGAPCSGEKIEQTKTPNNINSAHVDTNTKWNVWQIPIIKTMKWSKQLLFAATTTTPTKIDRFFFGWAAPIITKTMTTWIEISIQRGVRCSSIDVLFWENPVSFFFTVI